MTGQKATCNLRWAWRLVQALVQSGMSHMVISPGSRSTPLTLAALRCDSLKTHIALDERVAGFLALGLAKALGKPVGLIATSGSAPANWTPAVIEASMAQIPLILLSADRPPELIGCGANQAIDQTRLFDGALRAFHALPPAEEKNDWLANLAAQAMLESQWPNPGPVQINVAFREPLLESGAFDDLYKADDWVAPRLSLPRFAPDEEEIEALARRIEGSSGVIVCGAEQMPADSIAHLAEALDAPILADPLSGLRFGAHDRSRVMSFYDLTCTREDLVKPDYILRFGAAPVSKRLQQWLDKSGAPSFVVSKNGRWQDPARKAKWVLCGAFDLVADCLASKLRHRSSPLWIGEFLGKEVEAGHISKRFLPAEGLVVREIVAQLPENSLIFVGNSMAIRDFDSFSGLSEKALTVLCNRGASGIDGNIASFLGAASSGQFSAHIALLGDLTFLHDLGALAQEGIGGQIIILNNGGGAIFDYLAAARFLPPSEFEKAWLTPQKTDIAAAAAAFGHKIVKTAPEGFAEAFHAAQDEGGLTLIEVMIDRAESVAQHQRLMNEISKS